MGMVMGRRKESLLSRDVVLIMAAAFFYMGSSMLVTSIVVGYAHGLGAGGELGGLIAGSMYIVSLFLRPVAGGLADRMPKRRLVGFGAACLIAANVGYALAPNAALLMMARMVNGVGFSCVSVCLATWMVSLIPLAHVGKGMGLYGTVNALAMAIGPAVGIRVEQAFGYRGSFVMSTAMVVLMAGAVLLVRRGGSPAPIPVDVTAKARTHAGADVASSPSRGRSRLHAFLGHVVAVRALPVTVAFMMFAIPYGAVQSYVVTYVRVRRLAVDVSLFFPCYAIVLLLMRIVMRDLFDRLSFAWFLGLCSVCMVGSLGALTLMRDDWAMMVASALLAASYGLMSSVAQASAVRLAGAGHGGQANATYYVSIDLGMSMGPIVGGLLYAWLPVQWLFAALMAFMPAAVIAYLLLGRRVGRPAPLPGEGRS